MPTSHRFEGYFRMFNTHLAGFLALIFLTGCAADNAEHRKRASDWLRSEARTVVVRLDQQLKRPEYQVQDSQALKGAAKGALAGVSQFPPAMRGCDGPLCVPVGIVLIPVAALSGAALGSAIIRPEMHFLPLERLEGASALSEAASQDANLLELLRRKIADRSPTPSGHTLVFSEHSLDQESTDPVNAANFRVYIKNYSFVGETAENPNVSLLIDGHTLLETPGGGWSPLDWSFESPKRRISEWTSNEADLFRHEVDRAAENISDTVIEHIEVTDAVF